MSSPLKIAEEERLKLVKLYEAAETTPVIYTGRGGQDLASSAWGQVRTYIEELGQKYGFDPDKIQGIRKDDGEVIL